MPSQVNKIVLLRHGRPLFDHRGWIASSDMASWIERYNLAGIADEAPAAALAIARQTACVVTSSLARSKASALQLADGRELLSEPVLCEAQLPYWAWAYPRLPYRFWLWAYRAAWFLGFRQQAESKLEAMARACVAAKRLVLLAQEHGSVLLVGHGIMNRLIAGALLADGAEGPRRTRGRYWHSTRTTSRIERKSRFRALNA